MIFFWWLTKIERHQIQIQKNQRKKEIKTDPTFLGYGLKID